LDREEVGEEEHEVVASQFKLESCCCFLVNLLFLDKHSETQSESGEGCSQVEVEQDVEQGISWRMSFAWGQRKEGEMAF